MFLIVFVSLVGVLSAQMMGANKDPLRAMMMAKMPNMGMMQMDTTPMSKGCCGPRRFTANMQLVGATEKPGDLPKMLDSMVLLDYDYDKQMERLQMKNRDAKTGKISMVDVYINYNSSKTYSLVSGMCYVSPIMSKMVSPCLAANATYMGSYTLGSGDKTMMIDNWSEKLEGQTTHIQVQSDTCQTVSMTTYGTASGVQELMSYTFLSVKANILSAADTFKLPDPCKYAFSVPVGK